MIISCIDGLTMIGHSHPHQQQANTNVYYWWWWPQINHCVLVQPQEEEGSRSSAVEVFILVYLLKYNLYLFFILNQSHHPSTHTKSNTRCCSHIQEQQPQRGRQASSRMEAARREHPQFQWFLGPRLQQEFLLRFSCCLLGCRASIAR